MAGLEAVRDASTRRLGEGLARCLRADPIVRLAWLFGSRARRRHRPDSDVADHPVAQQDGRVIEKHEIDDPDIHDLGARCLHLAMEATIDIANHWIAETGLRTPESHRDSFVVLEQAGEIDTALSERLQRWAGFRNVLVHDYLTLDHGIAYAAIHTRLGDLEAFGRWALGKLDADA